jgi:hypothetical protein
VEAVQRFTAPQLERKAGILHQERGRGLVELMDAHIGIDYEDRRRDCVEDCLKKIRFRFVSHRDPPVLSARVCGWPAPGFLAG